MDSITKAAFAAKAPGRVDLDLTSMPQGQTYEDRYQGYLDIFKRIATAPPEMIVTVRNAPFSWVPLLHHLNCVVHGSRAFFPHDMLVAGSLTASETMWDRTAVEVMCGFRPELADALWKIDMQWPVPEGRVRQYEARPEFIVTNNGSFHRREVIDYMAQLREYKPTKTKVVLVPCAADKPYPAHLHKRIMSYMPGDWYMMNATGVVGLVPQDLWSIMPHYDSGIPNEWRLYNVMREYFKRHHHDQIVVYCDFYSIAIKAALQSIGQDARAHYILPVQFYADYVDLLSDEHMAALIRKLKALSGKGK